jgi:hypothetical protein
MTDPISKKKAIAQRVKDTLEAASAFIEDMSYFRSLSTIEDPEKADLRRSSAVLRRLLIDGDLGQIAAPRIGKFQIKAPDNKPLYVSARKQAFPFLMSGGASIFGIWVRCGIVERAGQPRAMPKDYDPGRIIDLRQDSFCKQHVLSFEGNWISRAEVIKYVANVSSGVHSGKPRTDVDHLIDRVRHAARFSVDGDVPTIEFNPDVFHKITLPIQYDPKAIDPVLFEILVTIHLLVSSPDIVRLEAEIAKELS